jgi:hypothetical protein
MASPLTLPSGYTLVTSGPFDAPTGAQSHGSVTCPGTREPVGGGAFVASDFVLADINSSYPEGQSWEVDVNNATGPDTNFTVYAECMSANLSYTIATASGTTGLGERDAAIDCPAHTSVVGGGVVSDTTSTAVNVATSTPFGPLGNGRSGWEVFMSSWQSAPTGYTVYAICRSRPRGWSIQTGSAVSVLPGLQAEATVSCPGASVPLGGGAVTQFSTTAETIAINSSNPSANTWAVYVNNDESTTTTAWASTVCAGT